MPEIETVKVIWPAKFGERLVTINAEDFNAEIHQLPATGGPVTETTAQPTERNRKGKHGRN